jgi:hypothetical protein
MRRLLYANIGGLLSDFRLMKNDSYLGLGAHNSVARVGGDIVTSLFAHAVHSVGSGS